MCTLEFESRRASYFWLLEVLVAARPGPDPTPGPGGGGGGRDVWWGAGGLLLSVLVRGVIGVGAEGWFCVVREGDDMGCGVEGVRLVCCASLLGPRTLLRSHIGPARVL